jgi:hypothetical protein
LRCGAHSALDIELPIDDLTDQIRQDRGDNAT